MESNGITLAQLLPLLAVLFSISLVVFGNTGGFLNTRFLVMIKERE